MIVVIVGPTGIGKTTLSIALAKHLQTEIISGDSVQVYKQLNVGSAKVTEKEKEGIPHHLIDIIEPTEDYSVAIFQKQVRDMIDDFTKRNRTPLIVGGTGLYIKSVLYDYNFSDTKRDTELEEKHRHLSNQELHDLLHQKDAESAKKIHPNNRKRVLQALSRSTHHKMSDETNKDVALYDFVIIGLTMEREALYERINQRVDVMMKNGLLEEVTSLYQQGIRGNAVSSIGYRELYQYLDGEYTLEEAIDKIKQHSRNLAKKQYTFFRNQFDVHWLTVDPENFQETINKAISIIEGT